MTPRQAAESFRILAAEKGLIDKEKVPVVAALTAATTTNQTTALSDASTDILRRRVVNFVGFNEQNQTVIVFTSKKVTKRELVDLPDQIGDVPIVYTLGAIGPIGGTPPRLGSVPYYLHNGIYTCGSSIFVGNRVGAGTLGCLVRNVDGLLCGLTNNHISGSCNFSDVGLPICAPGAVDVSATGSIDPFTLGHHTKSLPMLDGTPDNVPIAQNSDAAIFKIKDEALISSMQRDAYDTPNQTAPVTGGLAVQKAGRTSGLTDGIVTATIVGPENVFYSITEMSISKYVFFDSLYAITGIGRSFSEPGDSGSLITAAGVAGSRVAVGIVVAGNPSGITLALPIEPILAAFGATLVSGHNV